MKRRTDSDVLAITKSSGDPVAEAYATASPHNRVHDPNLEESDCHERINFSPQSIAKPRVIFE